MKKIVYVLIVLAILLGLAYLLKTTQKAAPQSGDVVVEDVIETQETADGQEVITEEAEVVVVDEEPAAEENEVVAEEVIEENPEVTAEEGETVEE